MTFLMLLGNIEISLGPAEEGNSPGTFVLGLFIVAIVFVVIGHYATHGTLTKRLADPEGALAGLKKFGRGTARTRTYRDPGTGKDGTERRIHVRRGGEPVPVWISESPDGAAQKDALVLDRSRGGLLLRLDEPLPAGAVRYVRAHNAPEDLEWIQLEVRSSRQRDGWLTGCKFSTELPWGVILMFG